MARKYSMNRNSLRNLPQYRSLSDEEFDEKFPEVEISTSNPAALPLVDTKETERKVEELLKKFEENYDLTEMLPNDIVVLDNLAHAMVSLQEYQGMLTVLRSSGVTPDNINTVDTLSRICSVLRTDISRMQDDLKITRKTRKSEVEKGVIQMTEEVIQKARRFYQQKMLYVFCDKCGILLGTVWTLYPDSASDGLVLTCRHKLENGEICDNKVTVNLLEIRKKGGSNRLDLMPEKLR